MLAEGLEPVRNLERGGRERIQGRNIPYLSSKLVYVYFDQCPQRLSSPQQVSPQHISLSQLKGIVKILQTFTFWLAPHLSNNSLLNFPRNVFIGRDTNQDNFLFKMSTSVLVPKVCLNSICSCAFPKEMYYEETHSKSTSTKGGLSKYQKSSKTKERWGWGDNCTRKRGRYNYCNYALILALKSLSTEFHLLFKCSHATPGFNYQSYTFIKVRILLAIHSNFL